MASQLWQMLQNQPTIGQQTTAMVGDRARRDEIRRQNSLAQLLQPIKEQIAPQQLQQQFGDEQRQRLGQAATVFRSALGSDYAQLEPEMQAQRWMAAKGAAQQAGFDLSPVPDQPDERWLNIADKFATMGGQNDTIQSTYVDDKGQRIAVFRSGRTMGLGKSELTADEQVDQIRREAAARASGQAEVELQTKPEIASAVKMAEERAKLAAGQEGEERNNQKAWNVYQTGMSGLTESLGQTSTGPFVGWLPAVSANAKIAEGAISAMAPVLKQMFRSAGEGNFTDSDQALLMAMVPSRSDPPEAIAAKVEFIDKIVKAKLGITGAPQQAPAQAAQQPSATSAPSAATAGMTPEQKARLEQLRAQQR